MLGYLIAAAIAAVFAGLASAGSLPAIGAAALVALLLAYVDLPVLAYGFLDPLLYAAGGAVIGALIGGLVAAARKKPFRTRPAVLTIVAVMLVGAFAFLRSAPMLHASAYRGLLGPVDTLRNDPGLAPVDPSVMRTIGRGMASRLAERVLGEKGALGSQVRIGRMELQIVRGGWYWVAPLDHAGFLRWLGADGTPGYVMVSASDSRDVRLVTEVAGKPLRLRYNAGAFLNQDTRRHLYQNGFIGKGLTDFSFEVDDAGRPFIVATEYVRRVGFGGDEPVGAVILDVQTGAAERCAIAKCPAWIDLIQPEGLTMEQIDDWGQYVHGWLNTSGREKLTTTEGVSRVLGRDGRQYIYTGITSVNADKGTTGYMLVDTRTGKATYRLQSGATEGAAMASAQGSVQEKGYMAGFPTPYNVQGTWSYLVPLHDDAGFVKAVSFVSVQNDQLVGTGEDVRGAMRKYRQVLANRSGATADDRTVGTQVSGKVARLGRDERGGDTYYYLLLEGMPTVAFVGASTLSPELPFVQVGDSVTIRYEESGRGVADMSAFDHAGLQLRPDRAAEPVR
jgi:hypothetical protein